MVKTMLAASRLVLFYSNDLIDQNMIEHGHITAHMETCSPEQAIVEILDVVRGDCQSRKLVISLKLEEIQGMVLECDRQRLQQILLNLVRNAIKFSHVHGDNIVISARLIEKPGSLISNRKQIEVTVQDRGIGIP